MCCRMSLAPVDEQAIQAIMNIFNFTQEQEHVYTYKLNAYQQIRVQTGADIKVSMFPTITAFDQHIGRRLQASIYYMIAGRYVEMTGGTAIQTSLVSGCSGDIIMQPSPVSRDLLVAAGDYHIRYTSICNGFQAEMKGTTL